jgi:hypothetical protein
MTFGEIQREPFPPTPYVRTLDHLYAQIAGDLGSSVSTIVRDDE